MRVEEGLYAVVNAQDVLKGQETPFHLERSGVTDETATVTLRHRTSGGEVLQMTGVAFRQNGESPAELLFDATREATGALSRHDVVFLGYSVQEEYEQVTVRALDREGNVVESSAGSPEQATFDALAAVTRQLVA